MVTRNVTQETVNRKEGNKKGKLSIQMISKEILKKQVLCFPCILIKPLQNGGNLGKFIDRARIVRYYVKRIIKNVPFCPFWRKYWKIWNIMGKIAKGGETGETAGETIEKAEKSIGKRFANGGTDGSPRFGGH